MKKFFALALMLVVFCVGNIPSVPVKASPGVLNVGPGQPFTSITEALGAAVPGDVIHVWNNPEPYLEPNPVEIAVPNIKIIGQSVAGVTILPVASYPVPFFLIISSGVTIMELTIKDPLMFDPGAVGIAISGPFGASRCKIWNNRILNFERGIIIDNSPNNEIIGNEISGCLLSHGQPPACSTAILMLGPRATNNQVRGNDFGLTAPNWYGVGVQNTTGGNTITLNNFYWYGISPLPQAFVSEGGINAWDSGATGLRKGNYWNDTMGWPPPYIIDPFNMDNFCSPVPYDWSTMPWDLNRDGRCSIIDIAMAAAAFGTVWSNLKWNPKADVVPDGIINIKDIATIARWYGWPGP